MVVLSREICGMTRNTSVRLFFLWASPIFIFATLIVTLKIQGLLTKVVNVQWFPIGTSYVCCLLIASIFELGLYSANDGSKVLNATAYGYLTCKLFRVYLRPFFKWSEFWFIKLTRSQCLTSYFTFIVYRSTFRNKKRHLLFLIYFLQGC